MKEELIVVLWQFARSFGWAIVAAISFAFAMGLAIKVFDMLSKGHRRVGGDQEGQLGRGHHHRLDDHLGRAGALQGDLTRG